MSQTGFGPPSPPSGPPPLPLPPFVSSVPPLPPPLPPLSPRPLGDDAGLRMLLPVGRSWVAIVAGYLGLISVLLVPAPLALGFGIWGLVHIKNHPGKHGLGRAIFGIVMGTIFTVILWMILFSFATTHGRFVSTYR